MARDNNEPGDGGAPEVLRHPQISLMEEVDVDMTRSFLDQLAKAEAEGGDIAMELTTLGGDAELARRIVLEIDAARRRIPGRFLFLGKTVVYSAGITIMSAFPRSDRYLTCDTMLMIHCRQLEKTIEIQGPMRASLAQIEAVSAQVKAGIALEDRNFRRLIEGSDVALDDLRTKALHNWYLTAEEGLRRGLVAGIVGSDGKPIPAEHGSAPTRGH